MSTRNTHRHRDRSVGLAVFGAIEILIGLGCAALVPLTLVATAVGPGLGAGVVASSVLLYTAGAAVFVVLGIGSIRARRWARDVSLSVAWVWFITGVFGIVVLWLAAPGFWSDIAAQSGLDPGTGTAMAIGVNLFLVCTWVVLPGTMVFFFRSPHVAATCRRRNPAPGWADGIPQRRLTLSIAFVFLALSVVGMGSYGWIFPLFGALLSGRAGAAAWSAVFLICLVLAWGVVRGDRRAWWTATIGSILAAVSSVATFAFTDAGTVLDSMKLQHEIRAMLEPLWPTKPWVHGVFWLVVWGSLAAYLIVIRDLFGHRDR